MPKAKFERQRVEGWLAFEDKMAARRRPGRAKVRAQKLRTRLQKLPPPTRP